MAPVMESHKTNSLGLEHAPAISHKPHAITHNSHIDEKLLWYFFWQVVLQYGIYFDPFHKVGKFPM